MIELSGGVKVYSKDYSNSLWVRKAGLGFSSIEGFFIGGGQAKNEFVPLNYSIMLIVKGLKTRTILQYATLT